MTLASVNLAPHLIIIIEVIYSITEYIFLFNQDPSTLPNLPEIFQTRAELTMGEGRDQTYNMIIYYDSYDKRTAFTVTEKEVKVSEVMYYDKNELFQIQGLFI